jgi:phenylpropionate dioxygenase-like ring-hydroxylating dioxygenase large terminal subunit
MLLQDVGKRFWHLACHRSELAASGSFIRFSVLGDDIVIYQDRDLLVFDNLCPHRGSRFLTESHGVGRLVCRYHGWSVRNGKVCVARAPGEPERLLVPQPTLRRYQGQWCGDFLFVSMDPVMDLREQLAGTWELLENTSRRVDVRLDVNEYDYECDWPVAVENALEPYHVPLVHRDSLGDLELGPGRNDIFDWSSVWYSPIGNVRSRKLLERMKGLFSAAPEYEGYYSIFVFPWSMLSSTYSYSFSVQSFVPSAMAGRTGFMSRFYSARTKSAETSSGLEPFFRSSIDFNRKVFSEDHEVCRRVHPSAWVRRDDRFLMDSEIKVRHFRDLIAHVDDIT